MIAFIDEHRHSQGVEPICRVLQIAPSSYHARKAQQRDPDRRSDRAKRDDVLCPEIERIWHDNLRVYGVRKVWHQLRREGFDVARCTVSRLMKRLNLAGVVRGKPVKTTQSDKAAPCPLDRVNRKFKAPEPNRLWGPVQRFPTSPVCAPPPSRGQALERVRLHCLRPLHGAIDVFARKIVGWKVSRSPTAEFVLHALEQALHERRPCERSDDLVHHSDRGVLHTACCTPRAAHRVQYVSIKYGERLAEAGIAPSVGSVGDSCDNALAETIIGLYKMPPAGPK